MNGSFRMKVPGASFSRAEWWLIALVSLLGLGLRLALLHRTNADLIDHFLPWLEDIRTRGLWIAVSRPFSPYGYTPFYSYALGLANALLPEGTDGKVVIKSVSIFFDYVAAALVGGLVMQRWKDPRRALLAYAALLFAPTVLLNGACWGQSDVIYVSFLLACLLALLRQAPISAMIFFSVALSIKLQAAWLGPFILMMILRRRIEWRLLALVPLVYGLIALPAVIAGRSWIEASTIYLTQAGTQAALDFDAANIHMFTQHFLVHKKWAPEIAPWVARISILAAGIFGLGLAWRASRGPLTRDGFMLTALASVLLMPLLLPHMHNRYLFPADVLALVLAFWRPSFWPAALLMQYSSLVSYISFLIPGMDKEPVPAWLTFLGVTNNLQPITGLIALGAVLNCVLLWRVGKQLLRELDRDVPETVSSHSLAPVS